jgi:hypothetical protein
MMSFASDIFEIHGIQTMVNFRRNLRQMMINTYTSTLCESDKIIAKGFFDNYFRRYIFFRKFRYGRILRLNIICRSFYIRTFSVYNITKK